MKILKELYYGNISEISRKTKTRDIEKEKREDFLYDTLKKTLDIPQNIKLLEEFINLYGDRLEERNIEAYINGFKTGLLIGIECSDINN